ncbi:nucleoside-diphosphate-sugar pyrophosphorylase [Prevotella sp. oral taxon 376]|uniref:NTP transferase domain-containing protein n=1 Tax=Prevotella sp. oral taxon 376 TaxID=712466 RepID=UPI000D1E5935|nr:NTP transferase domain-containing protein [Prevotella sp. oral taxon 376]PTL33251.1 nucleoside-diphosphate-sugar pyrophosphorylase [Prevotella sp. oral taxon 376]
MKYAMIAAGEGSRLSQEGIREPKPFVRVCGESLIDRLLRIFLRHDAEEIVVICNDRTPLVSEHLKNIQRDGLNGGRIPLQFVVKSTPSSMHSFYEISEYLEEEPFILTTVDTVFREEEFEGYLKKFRISVSEGFDGLMGVTDYIDDECPLYVDLDKELNIWGFHDENLSGYRYVSGGIYGLTPATLRVLRDCICRGESRMRNFQRALIGHGMKLRAYPFSKVLDIDHASDIKKAEEFLR